MFWKSKRKLWQTNEMLRAELSKINASYDSLLSSLERTEDLYHRVKDDCKSLQVQKDNLVKELDALKIKSERQDRHRLMVDRMHEYLGFGSDQMIDGLTKAQELIQGINDAWNQVGVDYPWGGDDE